ncbi:hypothetical protein EUC41_08550 [Achromobacter denitrificans]|uniref:hypothetical protein n=1 Tax=Achromobacter denitrificans TaxID=32002 RepID=UPI00240E3256|nr:hypothetical protein [Achromobacter denitrificans]WFC66364.1 hypothetical protein EUC41_08550 [Achromobacter denitrificans]
MMANQWLRLWHDLPNDPKWRTIARVSKQRIGDVIAVYLHVLVDASSNETERGRTQSVCVEDVATALDMENDQVEAILAAMQGRVMEGEQVSGWSKRQPAREDGSAERAKAWRERKKQQAERERTQPNAQERQDKDKEEDKEEIPPNPPLQGGDESDQPSAAKPKRERKERCTLKTFIERCRQAGETAISGYEPLRKYVDGVGLPMEFVQLAWDVFKAEHGPEGANERRLQSDWRRHFLNYVTKGYYRLWYANAEGQFALTTQGVQAQRIHAHKEAA